MKELGLVIAFLLVFGLAVRQISFILMFGSVFDWLRYGVIKRQMKRAESGFAKQFWGKANELFTCNVCMTAQISIWFCALPTTIAIHLRFRHPAEQLLATNLPLVVEIGLALFMGFMISMSVAAVALGLWNALSYLPKRLTAEQKYYDQAAKHGTRIKNAETVATVETAVELPAEVGLHEVFTFEDFQTVLFSVGTKCASIGCGAVRGDCRRGEKSNQLQLWKIKSNGHGPAFTPHVKSLLSSALQEFWEEELAHKDHEHEELAFTIYEKYFLIASA
ncbi:hypothetical protein ACFL2U_02325 [Patescibacteria group bacterium]